MKIDPNKSLVQSYPDLNFESAFLSNDSLYGVESELMSYHNRKFNRYVAIWEYGHYFISLAISRSSVHKSYITIAALITEAHSALRGSFLLNLKGWHSDSIVLLRKVHESLIRAMACKANPKKTWNFIQSSGIQKAEHSIGLDLKELYNIESSYSHSNRLKVFKSGIDLKSGKDKISVSYGPQQDEKEFGLAASISIFWVYVAIKILPKLLPNQLSKYWMSKYDQSAQLMKDYIETTGSDLIKKIDEFDSCLTKI